MAGFLWDDLQALVNGHPAAMNTNTAGYAAAAAVPQAENFSLDHLPSLRINEEDKPFAFPDFSVVIPPQTINFYRELEEIYRPFYQPYINNAYRNNNNTSTAITAPPPPPQMTPIPPIPNFSNFPIPNYDPYQDTFERLEQNSPLLPQPQPVPPPQQKPLPEPEQQVQAQGDAELPVHPEKQVLQARPRPRGRAAASGDSAAADARNKSIKKSSVKVKKICEVKATKLFDDLWAWRKYGQKPIKGSPFPRNYYRCSSSKGCSARKQVEKSSQGIDMFTVTYTGEHTHPRPPNRIPGTCGSRNKLPSVSTHNRSRTRRSRNNNKTNLNINNTSSIIINNSKNTNPFAQQNENSFDNDPFMNAFAASNEYSPPTLSPNTPLIAASEPPIGEGELTLDELEELLEEDFNDEADQEDDEMVMIPNMAMNEDLFMGFQELGWPIPENWGNSFNPPAFGSSSSRRSGSSSNGGKNRNAGSRF